MSELREIVAKNIYELRTAKKMTQFRLAEVLNYSDKAVSKWERAESIPDVTVLKQIADYFGVTVDYLLHEEHTASESRVHNITAAVRRNRFIITMLATSLVWLVATLLFVIFDLTLKPQVFRIWLLYVYSVPVSMIVLLVFNSMWGKRKINFLIISVLIWSTLASIYLSFFVMVPQYYGIWLVFVLGIPAQAIVFLWSGLRSRV